MSLILDALRKSETDRQQHQAPSFSDVPLSQPNTSAPMWLWLLLGLLLVNIVVFAAVLLRPDKTVQHPVAETIKTPVLETKTRTVDAYPPGEKAAVRPLYSEIGDQPAATPPRSATDSGGVAVSVPVSGVPPARSAPVIDERATDLPTLSELKNDGVLSLPELRIELHVYHDEPSRRLISINGRNYRESDRLSDGPRVIEIKEYGAVLQHSGRQFLLPRE